MANDDNLETAGRYRVVGALASPFSVKLRALVRYRRLAHDWVLYSKDLQAQLAHIRPRMVPKMQFPGDAPGAWRHDSSVLAYDLEVRHGERSIFPDAPALALISHLLEDFADEWGTKIMSYFRWLDRHAEGTDFIASTIVYPALGPSDDTRLKAEADGFRDFQTAHLHVPGITPRTAPLLEATYERILDAMEDVLREQAFLFGSRPSIADFAFFGQLHLCAVNPASLDLMRQRTRRLFAWLQIVDDASGVEGAWVAAENPLCSGVRSLLTLASETYLPYLEATAQALSDAAPLVRASLPGGHVLEQAPMKYHGRCLEVMRAKAKALGPQDRISARRLLEGTGCWPFLAPEDQGGAA